MQPTSRAEAAARATRQDKLHPVTDRTPRPAQPGPAADKTDAGRRRTRDRRGRGMRGTIAPAYVPIARSRSQRFDAKVLDAVEDLEAMSGRDLTEIEFAVEDVPVVPADSDAEEHRADVLADRGVPLSRILPAGGSGADATPPRIVLYRRPLEARAENDDDLDDVVGEVVAEQVAAVLGIDRDDLD